MFQIEVDGECVRITGIFYSEKFGKLGIGTNPEGEGGIIYVRLLEGDIIFERISKYPSELHQGERR